MIPQPITINGKTGTVVYLNDLWHPVSVDDATMARVLFNDGSTGFFVVQPQESVEKYDPNELPMVLPVQSVAGLGGLTQKFDESQHPRDKEGRFIEASEPRIFNRPSEVGELKGWPGDPVRFGWKDPKTGETTGMLLTGEPLARENIPPTLYHVTTNAPAVESSGVLLGQRGDTGLGGGQAEGVSFTSSREDATVIQRELRRAIRIARGDVTIEDIERFAREDEKEAGLPEGALKDAVTFAVESSYRANEFTLNNTFVWDEKLPEDKRGYVGPPHPPEERERLRRGLVKDAFNGYLQIRGHLDVPLLKNPILFGRQEHLAKLNPEHVQTLEVSPDQIPAEALVTTGSDKFLHEVRVYSDVPMRRRKTAYDPNQPRRPEGSSEGGQFAESGRSGVPTSDPELTRQAKEGIAAVEKLLPEAVKTSRHTMSSVPWEDLSETSREKVYDLYKKERYEMMSDEYYSTDLENDVHAEIVNNPKKQEEITSEVEKLMKLHYRDTADPASVSRNLAELKHKDGTDFTVEEKVAAAKLWTSYAEAEQYRTIEAYKLTDEYAARREAGVLQSIRQQWLWMPEYKRSEFAVSMQKRGLLTDDEFSFSGQPKKWTTGVNTGTHTDADYARTHAIAERLTVMRFNDLRQERGLKPPLPEYSIQKSIDDQGVTKFWVRGDAESGGWMIGHYHATPELAAVAGEVWAVQEQANRVRSAESIIEDTWRSWKSSSSEGLGLSLQLAAAYEFGGYHRMTRGEVDQALSDAEGVGGIETLQAYVRAQWEVSQLVMQKAGEDHIDVYRGLMLAGDTVKNTTHQLLTKDGTPLKTVSNIAEAHHVVTFDFNGEHFTVERKEKDGDRAAETWNEVDETIKAKVRAQWKKVWEENRAATDDMTQERSDELQAKLFQRLGDEGRYELMQSYAAHGYITLPPELRPPLETQQEAINRSLGTYMGRLRVEGQLYERLPDLSLKRAGAQSTTGTMSVANEWNGVGDLPPDPTRVVLRIGAPSTSVLSLPVYGQNEQGEHETVLIGTRDKWLWDAWERRAPDFSNITINGKPVPKKPLAVEWPDEELDYDTLNKASKSESQPLSIDLQAEDRGKPHWLSGTNFSTVLKWNESEHPRDKEGQFTESGAVQATQLDPGAGSGGGNAISPSPTPGQARPSAVQQAYDVAQDYNAKHGLPPIKHGYVTVDERRAKAIAVAYEALPVDDSDNPTVKEAYEALSTEIQAQWDHIIASGVQMIPWTKDGQPYQNSQEMVADVQNNKRLYFFTGGELHPLLGAIDPKTGLSMNDKFRAVHDYFGHAAGGYGFGARGEENAWISHSQMLTPKARRALTTETRGQNSIVNFGPQNYNSDGTYKHIPPGDRPFATQKVALLPDQYVF